MELGAAVPMQTVCTLVEKGAKILSLTSLMRCCSAAMRALRSATAFSSFSTPGCCFWDSCGQHRIDHTKLVLFVMRPHRHRWGHCCRSGKILEERMSAL